MPVPSATYRLQLRAGVRRSTPPRRSLPYLAELGVSHLYLSPILQAAPGSTHGYDVVDPTRVNDELGGEAALDAARRRRAAARTGSGMVLDIVPNHMAIAGRGQRLVVGRAGERPRRAATPRYFDVDWDPPEPRCATRSCCRSSATTTAGCSRPASWRWCGDGGAFDDPLLRPRAAGRAALARRAAAPTAAERRGRATSSAFLADALRAAARIDGRRPTATAVRAAPRQGGAAPARLAALCRAEPDVGRGDRRAWSPRSTRDPDRARRAARAAELPAGLLAHRRRRSSTTGASSTSPRWSACAIEDEQVFARHPRARSSAGSATGMLDGAARRPSRRPARSGRATSTRLRGAAPRGVDRGREDPRPRRGAAGRWPVAGTTGYDFLEPGRRPVRRPGRRGAADRAATPSSPGEDRRLRRRSRARPSCQVLVGRCWPATSAGSTALLARCLRAAPPLSRLHPPRAREALRELVASLSGLPDLRPAAGARRSPAVDRAR